MPCLIAKAGIREHCTPMFASHITTMYLGLGFFSKHLISPVLGRPYLPSTFKMPCRCQNCLCNHVAFPSDSVICHSTSLRQIFFQLNLLPPDCSGTAAFIKLSLTLPRNTLGHHWHQDLEGKARPSQSWGHLTDREGDVAWLQLTDWEKILPNQAPEKVSAMANKPTENVGG